MITTSSPADPTAAHPGALGADPDRLLHDVRTPGLLFESLVVRDLRVYAGALDATVSYYRDSTDLEADASGATGPGRRSR
jgi:hypothetical protein